MKFDIGVMDRHLLLQLGDRLRGLRKARGMTAESLAAQAGITRKTLGAVESGDPASAIGTYLRVMATLGISGELAMLAGDTFVPAPPKSAAARTRRAKPVVTVKIEPSSAKHRLQDLQSLALHAEAVQRAKKDPALVKRAARTLERWIAEQPQSRAMSLWLDWRKIIAAGTWSKALSRTARGQQLRQASPLGAVLPKAVREQVLDQVAELRQGIVLRGDLGRAGERPHDPDNEDALRQTGVAPDDAVGAGRTPR